jgi:hypothetical protein
MISCGDPKLTRLHGRVFEGPTMARLRLLFALFLMSLGTWLGALAISGYYEPHAIMRAQPAAAPFGLSASEDASQFINLISRQRFVVVDDQVVAARTKAQTAKPAGKATPTMVDKRPQQAADQWPWPLSLFGN